MNYPRVSVIVPCYNSSKHIGRCLESVRSQDYPNLEVLVVDDGSTDDSINVINNYVGVTVISQSNQGACAARNTGIKFSTGKYIKFLDSDDTLIEGSIQYQVICSERLPRDTITFGNYFFDTGKSKKLVHTGFRVPDEISALVLGDILTTTPLHRKEWVDSVGGFDVRFKSGQEWDFHVRLAAKGCKFKHSEYPVYVYCDYDDPLRISKRKKIDPFQLCIEQRTNLDMTFASVSSYITNDAKAAFSRRYWSIGRRFLRLECDEDAYSTFKTAIEMAPSTYKLYWSTIYRILVLLLGVRITEKLYKSLGHSILTIKGRI